MPELLDLRGNKVTTQKRLHDPEKVDAARKDMSARLQEMVQGYFTDMAKDPVGATVPDEPGILKYWDGEWRTLCAKRDKSDMPLVYQPSAFDERIQELKAEKERQDEAANKQAESERQWALPLKDITDFTPWEFRLVGTMELGTVWINSAACICVDAGGLAFIHLRSRKDNAVEWASKPWLDAGHWDDAIERADMRLGELWNLLNWLAYDKLVALPEALMMIARSGDSKDATPVP